MIRIQLKLHDTDGAVKTANEAIAQCEETGDLDYLAFLAHNKAGNPDCKEYLERAIKNHKTLSIPLARAKNELSKLK